MKRFRRLFSLSYLSALSLLLFIGLGCFSSWEDDHFKGYEYVRSSGQKTSLGTSGGSLWFVLETPQQGAPTQTDSTNWWLDIRVDRYDAPTFSDSDSSFDPRYPNGIHRFQIVIPLWH
ncbi:MAG: hypothetical protein ACHRHE_16565 [Tepidisphaerales bacterium]